MRETHDGLVREILWRPAAGGRSAEMVWRLRGPAGVIQWVLATGWDRAETREDVKRHCLPEHVWFAYPSAIDLGKHSPVPRQGDDAARLHFPHCDVLDGPCWYDGSTLQAEDVWDALIERGEDAAWAILRDRYDRWLGEVVE